MPYRVSAKELFQAYLPFPFEVTCMSFERNYREEKGRFMLFPVDDEDRAVTSRWWLAAADVARGCWLTINENGSASLKFHYFGGNEEINGYAYEQELTFGKANIGKNSGRLLAVELGQMSKMMPFLEEMILVASKPRDKELISSIARGFLLAAKDIY